MCDEWVCLCWFSSQVSDSGSENKRSGDRLELHARYNERKLEQKIKKKTTPTATERLAHTPCLRARAISNQTLAYCWTDFWYTEGKHTYPNSAVRPSYHLGYRRFDLSVWDNGGEKEQQSSPTKYLPNLVQPLAPSVGLRSCNLRPR